MCEPVCVCLTLTSKCQIVTLLIAIDSILFASSCFVSSFLHLFSSVHLYHRVNCQGACRIVKHLSLSLANKGAHVYSHFTWQLKPCFSCLFFSSSSPSSFFSPIRLLYLLLFDWTHFVCFTSNHFSWSFFSSLPTVPLSIRSHVPSVYYTETVHWNLES